MFNEFCYNPDIFKISMILHKVNFNLRNINLMRVLT